MKQGFLVTCGAAALLVGFLAWLYMGRQPASTFIATKDLAKPSAPANGSVAKLALDTNSSMLMTGAQTQPAAEHPTIKPYSPPEVSTPELRKLFDRRRSFEERIHGATTGAIPEVKDARDLKALVQVLSDPEEDETVRHEIANLLFRSEYAGLQEALLRILENPAETSLFRGWVVQHLGKLLSNGDQDEASSNLAERMRQLLEDRHLEVRREALLALVRRSDPKARETVVQWLSSEAPEMERMRDLAIRCAFEYSMKECTPIIRPLARSTNESIRIAAIVALSQWGDQESRPAIEEAATSSVVRIQRCAKTALARFEAQKLLQHALQRGSAPGPTQTVHPAASSEGQTGVP